MCKCSVLAQAQLGLVKTRALHEKRESVSDRSKMAVIGASRRPAELVRGSFVVGALGFTRK
jgi:hypothetical protein